jgi:hypothetical protein
MALDISRRGLITGLISFAVTAPAIVKAANLMPIKAMETVTDYGFPLMAVEFTVFKGDFYALIDGELWTSSGGSWEQIRPGAVEFV